jgi:hypothetical protein
MGGRPSWLPAPVQVNIGYIVDVLAGPRWYLVRNSLEPNTGLPCKDISGSGIGAVGPRKIEVYAPGTAVLYVEMCSVVEDVFGDGLGTHVPISPGYIIGAAPSTLEQNALRVCDWITPFDGSDSLNDAVERNLLEEDGAYENWSEGRPVDANAGSDAGVIHDFGLGYGVSRYFTWLRASDISGLWCFYLDNLTRLAAYNYEFWHAGGERTIKNDEGEVSDIDLFTPYPWEASGVLAPGDDVAEEQSSGGVWKAGAKSLPFEPLETNQTGLYRLMTIRGYLGDLVKRMVSMPPKELAGAQQAETVDSVTLYDGLLDIQEHVNGAYRVRSANSIVLEKYVALPVPKRIAEPETTTGTSQWGTTDPDKTEWRWGSPPLGWTAQLWDYQAYMLNFYGIRGLLDHDTEWYVPEESDMQLKPAWYDPGLDLGSSYFYKAPSFVDIQIDYRSGTTRYYKSRSMIAMLPDGSIAIEDGYGSSIKLGAGHVTLTCPGDVNIRPGRSLISWVPDDIVLKAGYSVDISAQLHDVRLYAKNNMHMQGRGILLDSTEDLRGNADKRPTPLPDWDTSGEAITSSGIYLHCRYGSVNTYAQQVYIEAKPDESNLLATGQVVIDAQVRYDTGIDGHYRFVDADPTSNNRGYFDMFRPATGFRGLTEVSPTNFKIDAGQYNKFVANETVVRGTLYTTDIKTTNPSGANFVSDVTATGHTHTIPSGMTGSSTANLSVTKKNLHELAVEYNHNGGNDPTGSGAGTRVPDIDFTNNTRLDSDYLRTWRRDAMGDGWKSSLNFKFRSAFEMGVGTAPAADWFAVEARWQQIFREKGYGHKWTPEVIEVQITGNGPTGNPNEKSAPHPGVRWSTAVDMWSDEDHYLIHTAQLWDWTAGVNKDRNEDAEAQVYIDSLPANDYEGASDFANVDGGLAKAKLKDQYRVSTLGLI